jgi:flagellar M-ring protein FliF
MDQIFSQFQQFFLQYSIRQRVLMSAVVIALVSSVIALILWANRPEWEILYSNLDAESANSVVEELRNSKVKYKLENGGSTIYVPAENKSEVLLKTAKQGSMRNAVPGYGEIFDKGELGMTTFMQRLNLKRALEGELTRTINQFPEVALSRVHLVIPESRLFEDKKESSAAVTLHLVPGAMIRPNQINGIAALVANSVEGLEPGSVVILDSNGNLLSERPRDGGVIGVVGNQYELKNAVEEQMLRKVTDIVEGVVGYGNAVVQVSTDLNFDQHEYTSEEYDPDKSVVVSEESFTENDNNGVDSSNYTSEKSTANYETSKKVERHVSNTGDIKRLTVAVLVDGKYETNTTEEGETVRQYTPRSSEDMDRILALVRGAVGYSEERGDIVEIQNIRFDRTANLEDQKYFDEMMKRDLWERMVMHGLIGIGLLLAFLLVRMMLKSGMKELNLPGFAAQPALAGAAAGSGGNGNPQLSGNYVQPEPEEIISEDFYMKKLSPEAKAKLRANDKMTEEVIRFSQEAPEDASKLIRSWLLQEKKA